jgi:hypothetical protein
MVLMTLTVFLHAYDRVQRLAFLRVAKMMALMPFDAIKIRKIGI